MVWSPHFLFQTILSHPIFLANHAAYLHIHDSCGGEREREREIEGENRERRWWMALAIFTLLISLFYSFSWFVHLRIFLRVAFSLFVFSVPFFEHPTPGLKKNPIYMASVVGNCGVFFLSLQLFWSICFTLFVIFSVYRAIAQWCKFSFCTFSI